MAGIQMAGAGDALQVTHQQGMSFGPQIQQEGKGVHFRLWAPSAKTVELMLNQEPYPMEAGPEGWYHVLAPTAKQGDRYKFCIDGDLQVPDPASRFQPEDAHGPSQVIDTSRFQWQDSGWAGRPWEETVLYELHIGTFSPEGTYQGAKKKLDHLVELGITAIELMPIADFPGSRNWGYDGVLHYAPDSSYGTPEDLKDLIEAAHQKGLMVFLDVVYNHFGPDGNYLHTYAKSFFTEHYHTPWGAAINFEGPRPVRDFFIENALYWLNEYHIDGLRFDAVHAIYDESQKHFLYELAESVRARIPAGRHVHLVLENDDNASRYLSNSQKTLFDAQWNDDFHHAVHVIATGDASGYYSDYDAATSGKLAVAHLGRCLMEGFAYQGEKSAYRDQLRGEKSVHLPLTAFVNFMQNHDQIGNRAFGERLSELASAESRRALTSIFLLAPSIPLLFMGEEWQAQTPFLFFCDFNEDLAKLVTEGRRKEFARFPEFSDPETRERIPDPSARETFMASHLDWSETQKAEHAEWLAFYKQLLAIRKAAIVPLLKTRLTGAAAEQNCNVFDKTGLSAGWPLNDGRKLILIANLGSETLTLPAALPDNIASGSYQILYQSGKSVAEDVKSGQMQAWSVMWLAG